MSGWRKRQIADKIHYSNTDNPIDFPNLKAGGDIHAGDGGYEIGNPEDHAAFVKVRNKSLFEALIREFAGQTGSTHKQSLGVWQFFEDELRAYTELVIKHTLQAAHAGIEYGPSMDEAVYRYFGIDE